MNEWVYKSHNVDVTIPNVKLLARKMEEYFINILIYIFKSDLESTSVSCFRDI